jgi:hypothetical protein
MGETNAELDRYQRTQAMEFALQIECERGADEVVAAAEKILAFLKGGTKPAD